MEIFVANETAKLEVVILGIGADRGALRKINPSIRKNIEEGTAPTTQDICYEIQTFEKVLSENNIEVLRPDNLKGTEQIFARDIGFVIEDKFFISNMKHHARKLEFEGVEEIIQEINGDNIIDIPEKVMVEGGDVILWDEYIFLGQGARTNTAAKDFLSDFFQVYR